jgi:hypothetical protein
VLLERVLRASLSSRAEVWDDAIVLHTTAEALEAHVRWILVHVVIGTISPSLYRKM